MNKTKLLLICVVGLVVLNLGLLAFLWFRPGHPHHGGGPGKFIVEELKFDEKQQAAFEKLKEQHRTHMDANISRFMHLNDELFALLGKDGVDSAAVKIISDSIAWLHGDMARITYDHFLQVRALCTPEQLKKFKEIIPEVGKRMRPPGPPPPPQK